VYGGFLLPANIPPRRETKMPTIKDNKTKGYTVMNNYLLDKNLSLKAKGLLCILLSLPDDWDCSINGLVEICKESKTAVASALGELRKYGYMRLERTHNENGTFEYVYNVYDKPINNGNLHK
jgi:predicted transcriptional regulator